MWLATAEEYFHKIWFPYMVSVNHMSRDINCALLFFSVFSLPLSRFFCLPSVFLFFSRFHPSSLLLSLPLSLPPSSPPSPGTTSLPADTTALAQYNRDAASMYR